MNIIYFFYPSRPEGWVLLQKKEGFQCGPIMVHRESFFIRGDGILASAMTLNLVIDQESKQILG